MLQLLCIKYMLDIIITLYYYMRRVRWLDCINKILYSRVSDERDERAVKSLEEKPLEYCNIERGERLDVSRLRERF